MAYIFFFKAMIMTMAFYFNFFLISPNKVVLKDYFIMRMDFTIINFEFTSL
jgi:hypothetical protein